MLFNVIFYKDEQGQKPMGAFIRQLRQDQPDLHDLMVAGVKKLNDSDRHGLPLTRPVDRANGIFELRVGRVNIARAFFFFQRGQILIVTNGYVKRQQELDPNELERARRYKADWEARNP